MFLLNQITLKVIVDKTFGYEHKEFPYFTQNFLNPYRPDPGPREKINSNFYFHTSLWSLLRYRKEV